MTSIRKRLSPEKAELFAALSNEDAAKLAKAIQEYKYRGAVPEAEDLPLLKESNHLRKAAPSYPAPFTTGNPDNVFIIGDLHAPFIREGYLEWCREQQEKWNCGTVICIGDICDHSQISYHEHNPDGMSVLHEVEATKEDLHKLFSMFPAAKCTLGNHDLLISRKAKTAGLSQRFIRTISEVYEAPDTWEFAHEFTINNVRYMHGGAGGNSERVTKESRISTVQGHLHTQAGISWHVSERDSLFALQTGCGIDDKAYAFEYGKPFPRKSVISAAVILDSGKVPISLLMPL